MLEVVASQHIETLVADLARRLIDDPLDPMTPEWIAVGSDGLQRWLQLELARHLGAQRGRDDGVAANITFAYPGTLRTAVVLAGTDHAEFDPWLQDRLVWSVLETLQNLSAGAVDAADGHTASILDSGGGASHALARRVASHFAAYQLHRPAMVMSWLEGHDVDAAGSALAAPQLWQPELWRLVRDHLGVPSPPERLREALERVRRGEVDLMLRGRLLPRRLVFFGPSLLPTGAGFLDVAEAVAQRPGTEVIVYVNEASSALSTTLRRELGDQKISQRRTHDVSAEVATHQLLRSWGRLQRETALLLAPYETTVLPDEPRPASSVLGAVQADIRANREPAGTFAAAADDRSVQLHFCYGATRQVEAARDEICRLLADDDTLSEDDIVVLTPDPTTFLPIVQAVFGASATRTRSHTADATPLIRYRISTGSATSNPAVTALLAMLNVATGRFEVTEVLALLQMPAVRDRFGWTDDHIERISGWLADTNVHWGLDPAHRERFGLPAAITGYSWQEALDQLLMGALVLGDDELAIGDVVPYDPASSEIDVIGQLGSVLSTLERLTEAATTPRTIDEWCALLSDVIGETLGDTSPNGWHLDGAYRLLARLASTSRLARVGGERRADGTPGSSTALLTLAEVHALASDTLGESRSRSDFFRGGITVTSLGALRNVPSRVTCVVGFDQAAFGSGATDSDDLIAATPRIGDRDRRAEVRQTLLDAVVSTSDHFLTFSDGRDVQTNAEIPPPVLLAELIETLCATLGVDDAEQLPAGILVRHPRHAFDAAYFTDDAGGLRSFNRSALRAALARRSRDPNATLDPDWPMIRLTEPMNPGDAALELDTLHDVMRSPTRMFLEGGVGIRLPRASEQLSARLPIEFDDLQKWELGTEVLDIERTGQNLHRWSEHQRRKGVLPPLGLADQIIGDLKTEVTSIIEEAQSRGLALVEGATVGIDLTIAGDRRILGSIVEVLSAPRRGTAHVHFRRPKSAHLLEAWVDLLCLTAADPAVPWEVHLASRAPSSTSKPGPPPVAMVLRGRDLGAVTAMDHLEFLVGLHDTAIRQPVPFFPELSRSITQGENRGTQAKVWNEERGRLRDERLVFGDHTLRQLREFTAEGHDIVANCDGETLLDRYANAVWSRFDQSVSVESDPAANDADASPPATDDEPPHSGGQKR
ncbi:MAG: exodeoxyribonuclease V subunit gamma [Microthrixaceae bacterium]|nr:exodeoxyribonuclease V subunit gamma [Microthrixaceae bacterium]